MPCPTPGAPFARVCASSRTSRGCYNPVKTMTHSRQKHRRQSTISTLQKHSEGSTKSFRNQFVHRYTTVAHCFMCLAPSRGCVHSRWEMRGKM